MHTEDEAKTRWCPFVRFTIFGTELTEAVNRYMPAQHQGDHVSFQDNPSYARCTASRCMAWRWANIVRDVPRGTDGTGRNAIGFCGLAGKP